MTTTTPITTTHWLELPTGNREKRRGKKPRSSHSLRSGRANQLQPTTETPLGQKLSAGTIAIAGAGSLSSDRETTDEQLVKRVQAGDNRAFDLLVLKYQHKIMSLISRYVKDSAEVQDVAQESFIRAYRALPKFRGDSQFYTWLYRIAVNTAKNWLISKGRRPPGSDIDASEADYLDGAEGLRTIATPEREIATQELEQAIHEAIAALPDDLRVALTLREYDGLSYEEIAAVMECPVGTVRSRIFRAREAVDQRISPFLDDSV